MDKDQLILSNGLNRDFNDLTRGIVQPKKLTGFNLEDKNLIFHAHYSMFENYIWHNILVKRFGWPSIHLRQWRCTAALAASHALPRALDKAGKALMLPIQKDMDGKRIMLKMCKPRKPTKANKNKWHEDPVDVEKLHKYCINDVEVERSIDNSLPQLNALEQEVWFLDQTINTRGIQVDTELVDSALHLIKEFTDECNAKMELLSDGYIDKASQVARIKNWMATKGVHLASLTKDAVTEALKDNKHPEILEVLKIRQQVGKTSVKKFEAFKNATTENGRVKDMFVYHGASTGRWAGKIVQLHNLPRGNIKDMELCIKIMKQKDLNWFKFVYPDVMGAISSCVRGALIAAPGKDLLVVDFAAIEARVLAWVAGEKVALEEFRTGEDSYVKMAEAIFETKDITKDRRFVGKQALLGCIAKDSMVYSDIGFIPIQKLSKGQKLWNGEKWVNFQKLVNVGKKNVIQIGDLWLTPDHTLLTREGWQLAGEIALSEGIKLLKLGKSLDTGQLLDKSSKKVQNVVSLSVVNAELKKIEELTNYGQEKQMLVENVTKVLQGKKEGHLVNMLISSLIHAYENDGACVGITFVEDVLTQITLTSKGMVLEAFLSISSPVEISWNILLHLMGGMFGDSHSIELIMPKGTQKEILELLHKERTISTKVKNCYDIFNVDTGKFQTNNFITHNCGYGMGAERFQGTCESLGQSVSVELAKKAVGAFRKKNQRIAKLWRDVEQAAINAVNMQNHPTRLKEILYFKVGGTKWFVKGDFLYCTLPSGRKLAYHHPKIERVEKWGHMTDQLTFMGVGINNSYIRQLTWGGTLVENIVQAIARDLLVEAMLRVEKAGYKVVLHVHDEIVVEVDELVVAQYPADISPYEFERQINQAQLIEFINLTKTLPSWAEGCPIDAEGFRTKRYRKG